jgi:subtilisin-like proprotein convertase family protein
VVSLDVLDGGTVQEVLVSVDLEHTYIGDLIVTLVPPASSDWSCDCADRGVSPGRVHRGPRSPPR